MIPTIPDLPIETDAARQVHLIINNEESIYNTVQHLVRTRRHYDPWRWIDAVSEGLAAGADRARSTILNNPDGASRIPDAWRHIALIGHVRADEWATIAAAAITDWLDGQDEDDG